MQNPKSLTLKQKKFLVMQDMDPREYLLERATPESYVFFEKKTEKLINIRR